MKKQLLIDIIAALCMLLFAYTAINKFMDLDDLKIALQTYPIIGRASAFIVWALPLTETIIVLLLFVPKYRLTGLYSSFVLMVIFTLYVVYMLVSSPNRPCTCGGMLQDLTWPQHLIFNIFYVLLTFSGIWLHKKQFNEANKTEPTPIAVS